MSHRFKRTIEDFVCENCDRSVKGNGYTNHCPYCLWSKHLDVNPGDRENSCRGLMKPIRVETRRNRYEIVFRCEKCGVEKRNKASEKDDFNQMLRMTGGGL